MPTDDHRIPLVGRHAPRRDAAALDPTGLELLTARLVVVGTGLMDVYTGTLTASVIAAELHSRLAAEDRLDPIAKARRRFTA